MLSSVKGPSNETGGVFLVAVLVTFSIAAGALGAGLRGAAAGRSTVAPRREAFVAGILLDGLDLAEAALAPETCAAGRAGFAGAAGFFFDKAPLRLRNKPDALLPLAVVLVVEPAFADFSVFLAVMVLTLMKFCLE
jgi:hypothetical protein